MSKVLFKRGDSVVYRDKDHVQWGPWEVVGVQGKKTTVLIDPRMSFSIPTESLRKVLQ